MHKSSDTVRVEVDVGSLFLGGSSSAYSAVGLLQVGEFNNLAMLDFSQTARIQVPAHSVDGM